MRLEKLLVALGDSVAGIIRDRSQQADLQAIGAEAVVLDLESAGRAQVAEALTGTDAVVFAAGAGPGSSTDRKNSVDRSAAILLADAAKTAGVARYVMLSGVGVDDEPSSGTDPGFTEYLQAKRAADDHLRAGDLAWTILRPIGMSDDPGTGLVDLAPAVSNDGHVTRDDVADVLAHLVHAPGTTGLTLELAQGDTPVAEAVRRAADPAR